MQPRSRRALHPMDRRQRAPRHPIGGVRRRWPRAYDGGNVPVNERYREAFDEDRRRERRRGGRRRLALDSLRQSPVRNGLIGLAVVGTAAPIAVNRYQQAMRTDASHERVFSQSPVAATPLNDQSVANAWSGMEQQRTTAQSERESVIQEKMQQYADYELSRDLAEDIYDMAKKANIDVDVAYGLVRTESAFKNSATSHVGAIGLTQLMPRSAAWLEPGTTRSDLRDQETNLRIGFNYLRQLIDKYDGDVELALTAYNRGPGTVDRVLKRGGDPDNGYAGMVQRDLDHNAE